MELAGQAVFAQLAHAYFGVLGAVLGKQDVNTLVGAHALVGFSRFLRKIRWLSSNPLLLERKAAMDQLSRDRRKVYVRES